MAADAAKLVATPEEIFRRMCAIGNGEEPSPERDDVIFRLGLLMATTSGRTAADAHALAIVMRDVLLEVGGLMDGDGLPREVVNALRFSTAFATNIVETLENAATASCAAAASPLRMH